MSPMVECPHDRVVRVPVQGEDYWICTQCNTQFILKKRVDWKIEHLAGEVARLGSLARMSEQLHSCLVAEFAISPCYSEDTEQVLRQYELWKGSNEQASRMRAEESI